MTFLLVLKERSNQRPRPAVCGLVHRRDAGCAARFHSLARRKRALLVSTAGERTACRAQCVASSGDVSRSGAASGTRERAGVEAREARERERERERERKRNRKREAEYCRPHTPGSLPPPSSRCAVTLRSDSSKWGLGPGSRALAHRCHRADAQIVASAEKDAESLLLLFLCRRAAASLVNRVAPLQVAHALTRSRRVDLGGSTSERSRLVDLMTGRPAERFRAATVCRA
jgi:hypothetical protein